jgi:hypothetical protein
VSSHLFLPMPPPGSENGSPAEGAGCAQGPGRHGSRMWRSHYILFSFFCLRGNRSAKVLVSVRWSGNGPLTTYIVDFRRQTSKLSLSSTHGVGDTGRHAESRCRRQAWARPVPPLSATDMHHLFITWALLCFVSNDQVMPK